MYRFGPFSLDPEGFHLSRGGGRLRLSASQTRLLLLFVSNAGKLLTREEIARCLWGETLYVDTTGGINTAINKLRAVLGDTRENPVYLETVVGLGYRFVAAVHEERPEAAQHTVQLAPSAAAKPSTSAGPSSLDPQSVADPASPAEDKLPLKHLSASDAENVVVPLAPAAGRTGRAILAAAALLIGSIVITLGLAVWKRNAAAGTSQIGLPALSAPELVQTTFTDYPDRVTASAVAHHSRLLAFAHGAGISMRTLDRGVDQMLWPATEMRVTRITWTPDDQQLIVSGREPGHPAGAIWLLPINAGAPHLIVDGGARGLLSLDGRYLAFTRNEDSELWVALANGTSPRRLQGPFNPHAVSCLVWLSNGKGLSFQRRAAPGLAVTGQSDKAHELHTEFDTVNAQTGALLDREDDGSIVSAAATAGDRLLYVQATNDNSMPKLYSVQRDAETGRFLARSAILASTPIQGATEIFASDDGKTWGILALTNSSSVTVGRLAFPGPTIVDVHRLNHPAPDNFPDDWTQDTKAVLFESDDAGKYQIYQQALDGTPARLVIRSTGGAVHAVLSPDAKWLLYSNLQNFRLEGIFRIPAGGGEIARVHTDGIPEEFECSRSSSGLCVTRRRQGDSIVFRNLDPVAGEGKQIAKIRWTGQTLGDWSLSPDGTSVAMAIHDTDHPGLELVPLNSTSALPTFLPLPGQGRVRGVTWAADGRGFFVQNQIQNRFYLTYVDRAGHTSLLRETSGPDWAVPSRDNTQVAFTGYDVTSNIWIKEQSVASAAIR